MDRSWGSASPCDRGTPVFEAAGMYGGVGSARSTRLVLEEGVWGETTPRDRSVRGGLGPSPM